MASGPAVYDVEQKWGQAVAERGFAQLPNYLLLLNQFLAEEHRLSAQEMLVLIQLVATWWRKDDMPFPSMSTLATRSGISDRQVQRAINNLEKAGLIQRVKRRKSGIIASNAYDLSPLVRFLNEISKAFPNEYPRKVRLNQIDKREESSEIQMVEPGDAAVDVPAKAATRRKVAARPRKA